MIESQSNWNYSHSILFYYSIPFFHVGAKATYTFNPKWSANVSVLNGWNNTFINHNAINNGVVGASSGLTYGGNLAYTPNMKWSVTENYYAGPVNADRGLDRLRWRRLQRSLAKPHIRHGDRLHTVLEVGFPRVNGDYAQVSCGKSLLRQLTSRGGA